MSQVWYVLVMVLSLVGNSAGAEGVQDFIVSMSKEHGFLISDLRTVFDQVSFRLEIIEAMSRPAEAKPWFEYREIFVTPDRIEEGVQFWKKNQAALVAAEAKYGVDPAILVAILGVETRYGSKTGTYRVIDALATLAFQYPKRASFFREQLEEYLLLARTEKIDPLSPKGSYAGAMGLPQFIPTSFRDFAVDLDGDGHRDIWNNPWDAVGSVGNYLLKHGWQSGAPIAVAVDIGEVNPAPLLEAGTKPELHWNRLRSLGFQTEVAVVGNPEVALLRLEGEDFPEYWLGFQNFYSITRYNHSSLYAMAVYQLAQEIKASLARSH
ncbi:Membrane-bound lytic murein transglycosylase B [Gammaproteobacteria bacterium]